MGQRLRQVGKRGRGRGGYPVAKHEVLGPGLGGFEPSGRAGGAKRRDPCRLERIDETQRQRHLGPDDDEVDSFEAGDLDNGGDIPHGAECHITAARFGRRAAVARRDEHLADPGRPGQRPRQGVFAPTGADDENGFRVAHSPSTSANRCFWPICRATVWSSKGYLPVKQALQ